MSQFPFYSYPKVYITVRTRIPPSPHCHTESSWLWGVTTDIALRIFSTISGRLICLSGIIVTGSLVRKSEPMYLSL